MYSGTRLLAHYSWTWLWFADQVNDELRCLSTALPMAASLREYFCCLSLSVMRRYRSCYCYCCVLLTPGIVCRSNRTYTCCRTCLSVARRAWLDYSLGDMLVHSVAPGGRLVVISFHPVSVCRCQKEGQFVYQANGSISIDLLSTCGARRRERIGSSSTLSRISLPQPRTQRGSQNANNGYGGSSSSMENGPERPMRP